jgi:hypothetical protein
MDLREAGRVMPPTPLTNPKKKKKIRWKINYKVKKKKLAYRLLQINFLASSLTHKSF